MIYSYIFGFAPLAFRIERNSFTSVQLGIFWADLWAMTSDSATEERSLIFKVIKIYLHKLDRRSAVAQNNLELMLNSGFESRQRKFVAQTIQVYNLFQYAHIFKLE